VIHLAAGLQFSEFKSVIGTLWEVDDSVAKHVAKRSTRSCSVIWGMVVPWTVRRRPGLFNRATHAVKTKVPLERIMVGFHSYGCVALAALLSRFLCIAFFFVSTVL
jgi:hypothetical protein